MFWGHRSVGSMRSTGQWVNLLSPGLKFWPIATQVENSLANGFKLLSTCLGDAGIAVLGTWVGNQLMASMQHGYENLEKQVGDTMNTGSNAWDSFRHLPTYPNLHRGLKQDTGWTAPSNQHPNRSFWRPALLGLKIHRKQPRHPKSPELSLNTIS